MARPVRELSADGGGGGTASAGVGQPPPADGWGAGMAAALSVFMAVRQSTWLLVPDVLVALGLVVVACGLAAEGSLFDLSFARAEVHATRVLMHVFAGAWFVATPLRAAGATIVGQRRAVVAAAARGLLLAIPVVLLLGWLLAQADAVFASFFTVRA